MKFCRIFETIYDSNLTKNWKALITFQQMIILADSKGIVDMKISSISRRTGIPFEVISEGLEFLSKPDESSRSKKLNGIRIILISSDKKNWGWQVVNYSKYKKLAEETKKKIKHPSLEEVIEYFKEKDCSEDYAREAFEYYSLASWHDSNNKIVINWKQKMWINWIKKVDKDEYRPRENQRKDRAKKQIGADSIANEIERLKRDYVQ